MTPILAVPQEQSVSSADVFHWDVTVTPMLMIQTASVPQEMFARIVLVNLPFLPAVIAILKLMILTQVAVLEMSVFSASVYHLDVNVIQNQMILMVSVLLDKSAKTANVESLSLLVVSVIQNLRILMTCVPMISGE